MARKLRIGVAVAIPLVALVASSSVGFAVSDGDDGEAAAPPTTALPALPPLPGTTGPATPTVPATTTPVVAPTVPPTAAPVTTTPGVPPTTPATGYVPTSDSTGLLTVELPASWADVDDRRVIAADGTLRPGIWASTDLQGFIDSFDTPGLILEAYPYTPDLRPEVARRFDFLPQACTDGGETPYSDGVFTGTLHTWNYCDGGSTRNFVLTASPAAMDMTIMLYAQTVTPEDEAFVNHAFETFNVVPGIGLPTETVPPPTTTVPGVPTVAPVPTAAPATVAPATAAPVTVAPVTVAPVPVPTGPPAGG